MIVMHDPAVQQSPPRNEVHTQRTNYRSCNYSRSFYQPVIYSHNLPAICALQISRRIQSNSLNPKFRRIQAPYTVCAYTTVTKLVDVGGGGAGSTVPGPVLVSSNCAALMISAACPTCQRHSSQPSNEMQLTHLLRYSVNDCLQMRRRQQRKDGRVHHTQISRSIHQ
jgi:hypothetical protein